MDPEQIKPKKNVNILKWILIVGILIVLNLFFNFAISSVYPEPKFDDFCKPQQVNVQPTNKEACITASGQWNENTSIEKPVPFANTPEQIRSTSYCDLQFTCRQKFDDASKLYQRNVFVALVVLGIISIFIGLALSSITAVSLGLSLGGVVSLVIGSMRYWSAMQDYLRVIVLGIALIALIWIGIKKFKD